MEKQFLCALAKSQKNENLQITANFEEGKKLSVVQVQVLIEMKLPPEPLLCQ